MLDLLDPRAVRKAVLEAAPDAIVHQATALANVTFSKHLDRSFAETNRLRREGTDALLSAAREAGVRRFPAQSYASMRYARVGGWVKSEEDPLDTTSVAGVEETVAAMTYLDDAVTAAGGIALRYGSFYGAHNDGLVGPVRKRQFPVVGDGAGVSSFIHLEDAAAATVLALKHEGPGHLQHRRRRARSGARVAAGASGSARHQAASSLPCLAREAVRGRTGGHAGTQGRGASNAKAKRELGWMLRYPSWRQGFVAAYAPLRAATATPIPTPACT